MASSKGGQEPLPLESLIWGIPADDVRCKWCGARVVSAHIVATEMLAEFDRD